MYVEHINTNLMVANPLTKGYHQKHLRNMLKGWFLIVTFDGYYVLDSNHLFMLLDTLRSH